MFLSGRLTSFPHIISTVTYILIPKYVTSRCNDDSAHTLNADIKSL